MDEFNFNEGRSNSHSNCSFLIYGWLRQGLLMELFIVSRYMNNQTLSLLNLIKKLYWLQYSLNRDGGITLLMNEKHSADLPHGVRKLALNRIEDTRGSLMEAYRAEWFTADSLAVQWNVSISRPGTFRGFHVHDKHHDILYVISGQLHLGLQDMRPWSPSYELAALTTLDADDPALILIPPGVAHGFWFDHETSHIYGLTTYWTSLDELMCHWNDSGVKVPWPFITPQFVSDKDQKAGTFKQMQADLLERLFPPTT
jgi:dTDP-4-dehydrorhamnose 3,5-epimerase